MPLPESSQGDAVDLSISKYAFKIMIFCEYVKFGAISWKFIFCYLLLN